MHFGGDRRMEKKEGSRKPDAAAQIALVVSVCWQGRWRVVAVWHISFWLFEGGEPKGKMVRGLKGGWNGDEMCKSVKVWMR
jgi:hypothetical protein